MEPKTEPRNQECLYIFSEKKGGLKFNAGNRRIDQINNYSKLNTQIPRFVY